MLIRVSEDYDAPTDCHWYAYDDDRYDGAPDGHTTMGTGPTRLEAIADLLEKLDD